jgi:ferredoxin
MNSDPFRVNPYLLITEDCINCRACDTICSSGAIYPGGKDYIQNNKKYKAPVKEYYYIVPEKCTFCEGVHESPECVAICPMDAIKEINKNKKEVINV